jgi:glycosyltransferase involved in cell wall biosynthesis
MKHVVMTVSSDLLHDSRVRKEAETLATAGYCVTVFSYIEPVAVPRLQWDGRAGLRAVPVARPGWQKASRMRRAAGHASDLWRWGGNGALLAAARDCAADIYHAHDLDTLAVGVWLARRHRARLVYDSHELFLDMIDPASEGRALPMLSLLKQRAARSAFARLERALIRRADRVITIGPAAGDILARRYGIPRPTLVLNCPPFRDLSARSGYLRQRLGLAPEQSILLLQGGVLPGRGLLELVQSLPLLPAEYHLVFLGFNLGTYQEPVRQEIRRLGLESRVHLLDALPPEQLLQATASADLGIILLAGHNLNDRIAMPNKMFEYMMAGLPFVATDWPEMGRVMRETGAGLPIFPLTPEVVANGIRQAFADAPHWGAMREAGLAAARREYNWERQAEHLLEAYTEIGR